MRRISARIVANDYDSGGCWTRPLVSCLQRHHGACGRQMESGLSHCGWNELGMANDMCTGDLDGGRLEQLKDRTAVITCWGRSGVIACLGYRIAHQHRHGCRAPGEYTNHGRSVSVAPASARMLSPLPDHLSCRPRDIWKSWTLLLPCGFGIRACQIGG
jgi:hypothetical protein